MWGVKWKFPASYNPQANGQAEAAVKIISSKLRLTINELMQKHPNQKHYGKWSTFLPYITMSYNFCPNEMTGFSPYELVFGRIPPLPRPISDADLLSDSWEKKSHQEHLITLKEALSEAREILDQRAV